MHNLMHTKSLKPVANQLRNNTSFERGESA
jgi:hypothetical protein